MHEYSAAVSFNGECKLCTFLPGWSYLRSLGKKILKTCIRGATKIDESAKINICIGSGITSVTSEFFSKIHTSYKWCASTSGFSSLPTFDQKLLISSVPVHYIWMNKDKRGYRYCCHTLTQGVNFIGSNLMCIFEVWELRYMLQQLAHNYSSQPPFPGQECSVLLLESLGRTNSSYETSLDIDILLLWRVIRHVMWSHHHIWWLAYEWGALFSLK